MTTNKDQQKKMNGHVKCMHKLKIPNNTVHSTTTKYFR